MTHVLRACKANKIKKLVVKSSIAAVIDHHENNWPANNMFDEAWWSDISPNNRKITHYNKAKTMAEKVAWDFRA